MAVRWDLLQPVDIGGMFAQGYERGKQMVEQHRAKSALAAFSANPMDPDAQNALAQYSPEFAMRLAGHKQELAMKEAERHRLGAYFANPDTVQARRAALQAGDIDVAKQIGSLDDETRKRAAEEAKAVAPVAYQALKLPYEQRKAYIRSLGPQLNAVGFTPDEIEAFDPSDAALNGIIQTVQTLEQARNEDTWKWVTRQDGSQYAVDSFGRPVGDPTGAGGSGGGSQAVGLPPASAGQPGELINYTDPGYDRIEAAIEQKYPQLPKGLLARIRTLGEKSNANEVSSAGARTVYQVIPGTRQAFLDKYKVDAYSSPEAAAEVAALHLMESIQRGEDPIRGYIGGPNQSQWGPNTEAYAGRVGPVAPGAAPASGDAKLRLIAQAREAIAAGAPEAEVQARLHSMGVSL